MAEKEELLKKYNEIKVIYDEAAKNLFDWVVENYEPKIGEANTIESLDELWDEVCDEIPNSFATFMMFQKIQARKKELNPNENE